MLILIPKTVKEKSLDCPSKFRQRLFTIVNDLYYFQLQFKKATEINRQTPFFSLNSQWLNKKYGKLLINKKPYRYSHFIQWLIDHKILERHSSNYSVGNYSYQYKFTEIGNDAWVDCTDKRMLKKTPRTPNIVTDPVTLQYIYQTLLKTAVDWDDAEEIEETIYLDVSNKKLSREKLIELAEQQLKKFGTDELSLSNNNKTGRVFSTVTSLKSELRKCLRIDEEKLVSFDIRNCIPAIFANLLNPIYRESVMHIVEEHLGADFQWPAIEDCRDFIKLTADGKYYEAIANYLIFHEAVDPGLTYAEVREIAKDSHNAFFFAHDKDYRKDTLIPTMIDTFLTEQFPVIRALIRDIKNRTDGYNSYKIFARVLQCLEVETVIRKIGEKLIALNIEFLPVHDSVMVKLSNGDIVKSIVLETLKENNLTLEIKED